MKSLFTQKPKSFAKHYFYAFTKRIPTKYTLKHSQQVEFQRTFFSLSSTEACIKAIYESDIERITPEFIINSDEISRGGSTSKRMKNVHAIVYNLIKKH